MTVTKINGFRAPYRSATFQQQAETLAQTNGLVTMDGEVEQDGGNVIVPPYTFIQNGLIVTVGTSKSVATPSMEAPYYLTVNAPTSSPVDDLVYQFAKAPTDISSNEVVIAAYDGLEWRMFPFISIKGVYDQLKQDRIDFDAIGPVAGLYTTENGPNYDTSPGTLVDPTGEVKVLTEVRSYPQIGDDPDWGRVDRVVYRRPLDAEKRIGGRILSMGGTYAETPEALYETQSHDGSLGREKIRSVISSDNTAHMLVASGYGNNWEIKYSKWSSDRQTEVVAPITVATASSKHFDVVIDKNDGIHLVFISGGDVFWEKLDSSGNIVAGPTQIDTQSNDCNYPSVTTDPYSSKIYIVYSSLITTNENNLFFTTLDLAGNTITGVKQLTSGSTNHVRPHMDVTEDLWVYLTWEAKATGQIFYKIMDDIGTELKAMENVSGATDRIGVGTLVDAASHPRIEVSQNRVVFVTFLQDKGGASYGISVWKDGSAFMTELVDPSESFEHYDMYLDSTFNSLHFILARSSNIDYVRLEDKTVKIALALQAAGASGVFITQDRLGSMFHAWTSPLAGTYTNYDTGLAFTYTGPQVVVGGYDNVTLQANDMLLNVLSPSQAPKKGDRVVVAGSDSGTNDGTYIIDAVSLASLNSSEDMYLISLETPFPAVEVGTPTADLATPDGNVAYFEKSVAETKEDAFRKSALASDILLARIVRPGPGILNYFQFTPSLGPDHYLPHGTEVSLDWSLTAPDNLTIGGGLNIYDMLNAVNFQIDDGSYPMSEGDALYVVLDDSLPSITPQVTPLNSLPFQQGMRVLGAVINGYFNPYLLAYGGVGILDPNEQVIIGEDVPQELRSKIGFISETEIEAYSFTKGISQTQTYPKVMGDLSLMTGQNTHIRMINGQVSWVKPDAGKLVFLTEAFLQVPELAKDRNRVAPQDIIIDAGGKVAWVKLNRESGAVADLTVNVSTIESLSIEGDVNRDVFILARRVGNDLIINGSRLLPGSSKDLDSDLTIENKALLGVGVTEATAAPDWSGRGSPQRNIVDAEGILEAITSLDVEVDKFFGQLRIVPHETDLDKVRVTGVDLTMKDGSILSQEISSLLMKFEGAVVDFTLGKVFESDGTTDLGIDFTPTTLADTEFAWYSLSVISSGSNANNTMNIKLFVVPGDAALDEPSATYPVFAGQKKIGMVLVTSNGGNIERSKIRQLGVGSGSGGGGGSTGKLIEGGVWELDDVEILEDNGITAFTSAIGSGETVWRGQSVTLTKETTLQSVFFRLMQNGVVTGNYTAKIWASDGSKPTGPVLETSQAIDASTVNNLAFELVEFTFAAPVVLPAGQYFFVLSQEPGVSGTLIFQYADGQDVAGENTAITTNSGTSWTAESEDFYVQLKTLEERLTWSADAYVSRPGLTNGRNTVPAGYVTLGNGQAAFVYLNALSGVDDSLTVSVDNIENISQFNPNVFIFARGVSDGVVVGSSFKLIKGKSQELDAGLSIENRALIGPGVTEETSLPGYSGLGAPERTIDDFQSILEGMSSIDTEIDKFFGQLRLTPDPVNANKVNVSGADVTMKDGAIRSQEISSLIMKFDGAAIDFETGDIDTVGTDFTPITIPPGEHAWYSVALVSNVVEADNRMTVNFSLVGGTPAVAQGDATLPGFAGQAKLGHVLVFNSGAGIEVRGIRQLGSGSGSGGGGGGGTAGKLLGGGDWKFSSTPAPNTLLWSDDAFVSLPGLTNNRNTIPAGSIVIADGQAAYAILNPLPGPGATVPVAVANIDAISPYTPNLFVFARGVSDGAVVGNSFKLIVGESKELDAGLSIENRNLLGVGITEATDSPDYSGRGAPGRIIDDSQKILEAITSIDVEVDKFFGQLRLIPHDTDANKVVITGADRILKDNAVLSQEIANLIMSFEGAVINFTTGEVFEVDGITPLGVDFTPATLADGQYAWYSLAAIANTIDANNKMTAQIQVVVGDVAASEGAALLPAFAGQKKIGQVLVTQVIGNVVVSKIRQLGAGSGSGGGGVSNAKLIEGGDLEFKTGGTLPDIDVTNSGFFSATIGNSDQWRGNTFTTTGQPSFLTSVAVDIHNGGSLETNNVYVDIWTIDNNRPDTLIATSLPITKNNLPSSFGVPPVFTFAENVLLDANTVYGFSVRVEGVFSSAVVMVWADPGTYSDGWYIETGNGGASWGAYLTGDANRFILTFIQLPGLAWSEDLYVSLPGLSKERNTIPAGFVPLEEGQAAYVNLNVLPGGPDNLAPVVANINEISPYDSSLFVFARGTSEGIQFGGSNFLKVGETKRLDVAGTANKQDKNLKLIGGGDWSFSQIQAPVIIESSLVGSTPMKDVDSATKSAGQTFTPAEDVFVSDVDFVMGRDNNPDCNIIMEISEVSGIIPVPPVLATSIPIAAASLPLTASPAPVKFTFPSPVLIQQGVTYRVTIRIIDIVFVNSSNRPYLYGFTGGDVFSGGVYVYTNNGVLWETQSGWDTAFRVNAYTEFVGIGWSENAFVQVEGLPNTRNRIVPGNKEILDGDVLYVNVNRTAGDDEDLTPQVSRIENISKTNLDAFILARRVGDEIYLGAGGNRLAFGDTAILDKPEGGDPSFRIKTFSAPSLSIKGGDLRTDDGFILVTGSGTDRNGVRTDITINLDTVFGGTPTDNTTYYLYVDRDKLGESVVLTDSGESVYHVEEAQFTITHMAPNVVSPYRFIHVETLRYGTGAWANAYDAPRFLPDSVGGFFDTIQVFKEVITSAVAADYTHNLDAAPGLYTLDYFDGSRLYPLDNSSHIVDVGDTSVFIDTSTLDFSSGQYVVFRAYRYPSTQLASISNEFTSPWFTDALTVQFPHGMVDAQDIRDYEVQEWDTVAGKIRNIHKDALVTGFDDTNMYFNWVGLLPSSTLRYRVVGGRSSPVTSVPIRYGGFDTFVGMGPGSYSTLQEALSFVTPGASILVAKGHTISAPIDINISDIKIEFMPKVVLKVISGTSDGIIVSGSRVDLLGLNLEGDQNAVMTNLLRISGDDCQIERARLHINDLNLTVTNVVNIEGDRNYVTASVRTTAGAVTNTVVDSGIDNDYSVRG